MTGREERKKKKKWGDGKAFSYRRKLINKYRMNDGILKITTEQMSVIVTDSGKYQQWMLKLVKCQFEELQDVYVISIPRQVSNYTVQKPNRHRNQTINANNIVREHFNIPCLLLIICTVKNRASL